MKLPQIIPFITITILTLFIISCSENNKLQTNEISQQENEQAFNKTLDKHLNAIVNKDLDALKSTMSPDGKMQLIMQGTEIINSVDSFINFHEGWFQDTLWTMETKVLRTEIGNTIGLAVTESMYREPERNDEPYYNRMIVTYALEKNNDKWCIINDHASTIEKSTDKK